MEICIQPTGEVVFIYQEAVDLSPLGAAHTSRASHVEPDPAGLWWADLGPVIGPRLGPFALRSQALAAESAWLDERLYQLVLTFGRRS